MCRAQLVRLSENPPSFVWCYDRDRRLPPPAYRSHERSCSPRCCSHEREPVGNGERERERDYRGERERRGFASERSRTGALWDSDLCMCLVMPAPVDR